VLSSSQDHLRTRTRDIDHPVLPGAENTDSWHARKEDLQRSFPLDVQMVHSSTITIRADSEHLTCGGFSLGETVCLESFEFIADYFGSLSLSPRRGDLGVAFMGSTCSGTPPPCWAMIEDFTEEFLTALSGEGGFGLPSPRRCGTRALPTPVTTTPWTENAPPTQAMMNVPPWMAALRPDIFLPFEQCRTRQCRQQEQAHSRQPTTEPKIVPR
jgi:hypothetical protein